MKTIELDRAQLDWAVAQALRLDTVISDGGLVFVVGEVFMPHAYWEQAGPIIERECINLKENGAGWWFAKIGDKKKDKWMRGTDPLMAAMRCFVARRLGDDVTVPDGLV
jgi:hypothetical protein